jgi:sugar phosphate isomerase/epimerase
MNNRRNFLKTGSLMAGSLLFAELDAFATPVVKLPASSLIIMATNWGFKGNLVEFCAAAKKDGYDGIEVWVPGSAAEMKALSEAVSNAGLQLGLLAGGHDANPILHKKQFSDAIERAISLKPLYINCHSGRDYFSFDDNAEMVATTIKQSAESGVPIYHETHRGRMLFAAHVSKGFIDRFKELKLTLDISHWCNVHESLLGDQPINVEAALSRTHHIHARIGHAEGPQVNDPRAPEWKNEVKAHFDWWDNVIARKKSEGQSITILTEFGPPNYLQTLPYTGQPVADQWAINKYMMETLRKRYS